MNRYTSSTVAAYFYKGKYAKKNFIADFCEKLQGIKKNIIRNPRRWEETFYIEPTAFIRERWHFEIMIYADKFVVKECVLTLLNTNTTVRYCTIPKRDGTPDNIFRNITEFREFLKREVTKEE